MRPDYAALAPETWIFVASLSRFGFGEIISAALREEPANL